MKDFCETYNLKNLIDEPTGFKNPNNPSSIDFMLTNKYRSFQHNHTIETGLSDHHKMTLCFMTSYFPKQAPIRYRNFKKFDNSAFRTELFNNLNNYGEINEYDTSQNISMDTFNKHAPMKEKYVRANNSLFWNKTLNKALMTRSRLKNKYLKFPSVFNKKMFKKHRNFCINLLRREKKIYYDNLDINCFTDNKNL